MNIVFAAAVLAVSPSGSPEPSIPPEEITTPGPPGFFVTLFVAAGALLAIDMVRRIRRVRYREQVRAELAAEEATGDRETGRAGLGEQRTDEQRAGEHGTDEGRSGGPDAGVREPDEREPGGKRPDDRS